MQLLDVGGVHARRRLVEDVEVVRAALQLPQLVRQLDALRFPAGELRRRVAQLEVAQAQVAQRAQFVDDAARDVSRLLEESHRFLNGQVQHVGDALAAVRHFQRLGVVARALATGHSVSRPPNCKCVFR
jgi:cell division septum initiation protein DivIVA